MDIATLNDFFTELKNDEMSLLYSGNFSDEVTAQVIGLSGAQFDDGSDLNKLQKKTGFLIAECFQNIVRHNESSIENGFFLTRNDEGMLHIASGNIVANEAVETLSEKLENLNSLSKDELKQIYVETLKNNQFSEKGGAGLGLIEMARKSRNKLDFEFRDVGNDLSYFYFQMKFEAMMASDGIRSEDLSLSKSIDLRKKLLENNIFLVYQGDISMNTILPIINMVEKSIASQEVELHTEKKVMIALMEFLQNMSKHGMEFEDRQDGIILIGERNGSFLIGGSNHVGNEDKEILERKLNEYRDMSVDELNEQYKNILRNGDPENKKGSSLGIIEMLRRSSTRVEYNFTQNRGNNVVNILLQI